MTLKHQAMIPWVRSNRVQAAVERVDPVVDQRLAVHLHRVVDVIAALPLVVVMTYVKIAKIALVLVPSPMDWAADHHCLLSKPLVQD